LAARRGRHDGDARLEITQLVEVALEPDLVVGVA
jgi:hypothetical protein